MANNGSADGVLVGLEIHQQLACSTKLFCACPPAKSDELPYHFERRLRPAQSETGKVDPAAVFEFSRSKPITYYWSPESSCLVEADEEPPHPLSAEALDATLLVAMTLGSNIVDEVHVMRKIVIDGSNTAGFQRTAVVGLGGSINVEGTAVGVQSVTVEEDAARIVGEDASSRQYALDRLGVALVEVALAPMSGDPEFVGKVALHLGRVLRSTELVARGLGTIRQDLNVSLRGGNVVEVKGVQKLNLLPRVVEYERRRQEGLARIAGRLSEKGIRQVRCDVSDVTSELAGSSSRLLRAQISEGGEVTAVVARGLGGLIGWEPVPGVRLGRELAEVARANSLGGVIHSDEFERQGISDADAEGLRKATGSTSDDAIVLLAGKPQVVASCVPHVVARLRAAPGGVPAETRAATDTGETRFMRPRPGSQRMYPETDIPEIVVTGGRLGRLRESVPEDWGAKVRRLSEEYSLSSDLALKLYDSDLDDEFAKLSKALELEPSVVASVLADLPPRLAREGVPESALTLEALSGVLRAVSEGKAAKEAIPEILKAVGKSGIPVSEAIKGLGLAMADESTVRMTIDRVLARHASLVKEKGDSAFSPIKGEVKKEQRARADGGAVGRMLKEMLSEASK